MNEFAYTARDRTGNLVEGTVFAHNSALAAGKVQEMGLTLEKVRVVEYQRRPGNLAQALKEEFVYPVASGVPLKDLVVFYRQFATMIDAGLPLYQSLVTLAAQTRNAKLREILEQSQAQVQNGGRLSEVFSTYPWVFGELQIEMIRAAEHGGMLDQMLLRIADYLEHELEMRRMISRLTLYPKIVAFSAVMILGKQFFMDGMPAFAKLIVGSMGKMEYSMLDYLMDTVIFMAIVAVLVFAIVAFCRIVLFKSDDTREAYERFKMSLPGLGTVVRGFALAKFGRAFGAMYAGGLPLNSAIRVAGRASGNKMIMRATHRAIDATERGAVLSQAFHATGVFPPIIIDMLHTGEQTGNVDSMMSKAADYLEGDAQSKAHLYSHIFAVTVYGIVAALVGFAIVRFYMGYYGGAMSAVGEGGTSGQ